jgi:hypothetical protein
VAELDVYLGVAPVAALLLLLSIWRRLEPEARVFLAATVAISVPLLVEVAAFASLPSVDRVEERNLFYLAPLALIALLVWIEHGLPRPPGRALAAALAAGVLPVALPFAKFIGLNSTADTLSLLPWWRLQDHAIALQDVRWVATGCALWVAACWLLVPARAVALLIALVAGIFVVVQIPVQDEVHGFRFASLNALFGGITKPHVDWIDRAVGRDTNVAVLWTGKVDYHVAWENEFFNRSLRRFYYLDDQKLPGGLAETRLVENRRTGVLLTPSRRRVREGWVLVAGPVTPLGAAVAVDAPKGAALYRLDGPLVSTTRISGVYDDTWSGPRVSWKRLYCRPGTLTVLLQSDTHLFRRPQTVSVRSSGLAPFSEHVRAASPLELVTRVVPRAGRCRVDFTVAPTAVPGRRDRRRLGLHFLNFDYRPAG